MIQEISFPILIANKLAEAIAILCFALIIDIACCLIYQCIDADLGQAPHNNVGLGDNLVLGWEANLRVPDTQKSFAGFWQ